MDGEQVVRVVVAKRGKVKVAEFRLRPGELGLSLFRKTNDLAVETVVEAVRAAGKRGSWWRSNSQSACSAGWGYGWFPRPAAHPTRG